MYLAVGTESVKICDGLFPLSESKCCNGSCSSCNAYVYVYSFWFGDLHPRLLAFYTTVLTMQ
jgi:hypothetical protein